MRAAGSRGFHALPERFVKNDSALKVLFNPIYPASPHFETELELMRLHLEKGDAVHALLCDGALPACLFNPAHRPSVCALCRHITQKGLALLGAAIERHAYSPPPAFTKPAAPRDMDELKRLAVDGKNFGLAIASTLISQKCDEYCADPEKYKDFILRAIEASALVYESVKRLLETLRPDRVYLFNGRFFTVYPALLACEEAQTPYMTHERGCAKDKYALTENALPHELAAIDKKMQRLWAETEKQTAHEAAKRFFISRRNGDPGILGLDSDRIRKRIMPDGFDPAKKNIVICNSSITEFAAIRGFDRPFGAYDTEPDAVKRIGESLASRPDIHVYLRMHPPLFKGESNAQIKALLALDGAYPNLTVIHPESAVDTYSLMDASNIVVVFHSTVGAEACFIGKPVVVLGYAAYRSLGCVYTPKTHEEIIALLASDLEPLPNEPILKYGLWMATHGIPYRYYEAGDFYSGVFRGVPVCRDTRPLWQRAKAKIRDIRSLGDLPYFFAYLSERLRAALKKSDEASRNRR
jgi:hypothetical protein